MRDALLRHEELRRAASLRRRWEESTSGQAKDAAARDDDEPPFPAVLGETDVLVLPRFDVVRAPAELEREVRAVAPDLSVL